MRAGALLWFALSALAGAQELPSFRATVSLVHIDAEVVSADGRIIAGLGPEDFRVFDADAAQPILHFSEAQEPLDLILLFDISGSMRPKVQAVAAAAREGVGELRGGDRVAIMTFNTHARMLAPFTEDLAAVQRSIQQDLLALRFRGGTFIQSAVLDAAQRLRAEPRTGQAPRHPHRDRQLRAAHAPGGHGA